MAVGRVTPHGTNTKPLFSWTFRTDCNMSLFDDEDFQLTVNEKYADRYLEEKKREELANCVYSPSRNTFYGVEYVCLRANTSRILCN
jgi:hypothetical protein